MKYVVISPVRDEGKHIASTIHSMVSQSVRPQQWILVNDGSSDDTPERIDEAAQKYDWISAVHRRDRSFRHPGTGVMESFYEGYDRVIAHDWEWLVKLDGDLSFDSTYFENCLRRFERDPKLGIGGGTICTLADSKLVPEAPDDPAFHVRGATKIYRRKCWEAIGGLIKSPGWDTVDEYSANMLGWITYTFPELKLRHHRFEGGAEGTWNNCLKNGLANYVAGYHPLFMIVKCGRRTFAKPYCLMALGLLVGFTAGYLRRVPRVNDKNLIRYVRGQQMRRLLFRESLWDRRPT